MLRQGAGSLDKSMYAGGAGEISMNKGNKRALRRRDPKEMKKTALGAGGTLDNESDVPYEEQLRAILQKKKNFVKSPAVKRHCIQTLRYTR